MSLAQIGLDEYLTPKTRILLLLVEGEKNYRELFNKTGVAIATFYKYLQELQEDGLIRRINHGKYEITEKGRKLLLELARLFEKARVVEVVQ